MYCYAVEFDALILTKVIVLQAETLTAMRLLGAKNVSELGPKYVSIDCERDLVFLAC